MPLALFSVNALKLFMNGLCKCGQVKLRYAHPCWWCKSYKCLKDAPAKCKKLGDVTTPVDVGMSSVIEHKP